MNEELTLHNVNYRNLWLKQLSDKDFRMIETGKSVAYCGINVATPISKEGLLAGIGELDRLIRRLRVEQQARRKAKAYGGSPPLPRPSLLIIT